MAYFGTHWADANTIEHVARVAVIPRTNTHPSQVSQAIHFNCQLQGYYYLHMPSFHLCNNNIHTFYVTPRAVQFTGLCKITFKTIRCGKTMFALGTFIMWWKLNGQPAHTDIDKQNFWNHSLNTHAPHMHAHTHKICMLKTRRTSADSCSPSAYEQTYTACCWETPHPTNKDQENVVSALFVQMPNQNINPNISSKLPKFITQVLS